jgi:hypothetical protein
MDFSTISVNGLFALLIIGVLILVGIVLVSRVLKSRNMSLKVGDNSFDLNASTQTYISVPDNIMHKKRVVAEAHMDVIAIALEKMAMYNDINYKGSSIAQLLFELLNRELEVMVLKNIMDNHIGDTQEELNLYVDIRSREYAASIISFYKKVYHHIPDELKMACKEESYNRLETFFKKELMQLFRDIKALDKLN